MPTLSMPTRDYGLMRQLKTQNSLEPELKIEFPAFDNILVAARQMVRELAFDICEMPITTYLVAKSYGKKFTAIPVFLTRNFHHSAIFVHTQAGINHPKDLEGKKVGVIRGYTVTTGVWARGVLSNEYGVDLKKIQWAATDDEHVSEFEAPPFVDYNFKGQSIAELFSTGKIVAGVGALPKSIPDVKQVITNAKEAGFLSYKKTGIYPVNHTVVVKDELLEKIPHLGKTLFEALKNSKEAYLSSINRNNIKSDEDRLTIELEEGLGSDPFPYGIQPNRKALEALNQTAFDQLITPEKFSVEELFADGTLELCG
ncbi:MAG: ABC transporter substrate-binding protein [Pseudomonadota bacterium]|nr:ABC transporter substrate-binding protein [Pseudomonadota bacterium]